MAFEVEDAELALGSPFHYLRMLWPLRWRKKLDGLRELRIGMQCCNRFENGERRGGRTEELGDGTLDIGLWALPSCGTTDQDPSHGIHPGIPCQDMERVEAYLAL